MPDRDIPIRPAATVILLRQQSEQLEVLLLHRNHQLVFGGDHWVFPGGRIDEQDYIDAHNTSTEAAAKSAAVRETREEASLHIESGSLTAVSQWTTPRPSPKRYNTAFFVTCYQHSQPVLVDGSEIIDHQWLPPLVAIEHFDRGDKKMMPPTIYTFYRDVRRATASGIRQLARACEIRASESDERRVGSVFDAISARSRRRPTGMQKAA
jgi:8-oxo-dGTP pyrophosphatase MutT (NUDIX family)